MSLSPWEHLLHPDQDPLIKLKQPEYLNETDAGSISVLTDRDIELERLYNDDKRVAKLDRSAERWSTAKRYLILPPIIAAVAINVSGDINRKDPNTIPAEDTYVAVGAAMLFLAGKGMQGRRHNKATKIAVTNIPVADRLNIPLPGRMQAHVEKARQKADSKVIK